MSDSTKTKAQLLAELKLWRSGRLIHDGPRSGNGEEFSTAQLAGILLAADDAIVSTDEKFRIVIFNRGAERTFGYSAGEVLGRSLDFLLPKGVGRAHRDHITRFAEATENSRLIGDRGEVRGRRKNGETFPAEASISRIEVGGRVFFTAILRDVSRRKADEEKLKESRELRASFMASATDGFCLFDSDLNLIEANRKGVEPFGVKKEEAIGKNLADLAPEALSSGRIETYREVMRTGKAVELDHFARRGGGEEVFVSVKAFPLGSGLGTIARDFTKQKRTEEALRASERLLQTVFDNIPLGIFVKDTARRVVIANNWDPIEGLIDTEIIGLTDEESGLFSAALNKQALEEDQYVLTQGKTMVNLEKRLRISSGKERLFRFTKAPLFDDQGEVTGLVGIREDITERKKAEEELEESQRLLQTIIDTVPLALAVKDADGRYIEVSKEWSSAFGVAEKEALGHTGAEVLPWPEEQQKSTDEEDQAVLKGETALLVSEQIRRNSEGEERVFHTRKVPLSDSDGKILGLVAVGLDITERVLAEKALRDSEEKLRAFFDHSPSGILLRDLEGSLQFMNRRLADWLGVSAEELIGKDTYALYAKNLADQFAAREREVVDTGTVDEREVQLPVADGSVRDVISNKFPVFDGQQRIVGVGTIVTDVTSFRKIEEQLRESQKMEAVGQLAGGIAHEFNNMLQVIMSAAYVARKNLQDPAAVDEHLETILATSERSAGLTRQLLAFSRKNSMQKRALDLNRLMAEIAGMVGRLLGEQIEFTFRPGAEVAAVEADPAMLEQVILNLCLNARDAMPQGGTLTLETTGFQADPEWCAARGWGRPGAYAKVSVSDTGVGMTPEIRERIFEPFFTTKEVGHGTGLGLAMVYGTVQQHEGRIEVFSEPGRGSAFEIYLPGVESAGESEDAGRTAEAAGGSEVILLAEDEAGVLELMSRSLERKGYRVLTAADGEEAVSLFTANADSIDLVILDLVMPKMRGREVFGKIRETGSLVPVLFSTAYSASSGDLEFFKANGLRLISKPHLPEELFGAVRKLLDQGKERIPRAGLEN